MRTIPPKDGILRSVGTPSANTITSRTVHGQGWYLLLEFRLLLTTELSGCHTSRSCHNWRIFSVKNSEFRIAYEAMLAMLMTLTVTSKFHTRSCHSSMDDVQICLDPRHVGYPKHLHFMICNEIFLMRICTDDRVDYVADIFVWYRVCNRSVTETGSSEQLGCFLQC